jgi:hydroxyethylthiazole kinase
MAFENAALSGFLKELRAKRPLIHNVTNFVVMNWTANVLLAAGASPAMVHAPEEAAEFAAISSALVVNIGTLDANFVAGMERAIASANAKGVPWALDPVGVGATPYRSGVAARLAGMKPSVIRANASEIMALAGIAGAGPKGVDSTAASNEAVEAGLRLATATGAVVCITGATDYVITGHEVAEIDGGDPMSQQVTGTGCAATALIGAFLAISPPRGAALAGLTLMKRAAERAATHDPGPGTFAVRFIDALAQIS